MTNESILRQQSSQREVSKSVGLRLKETDLAILNQRFKIDGFQNLRDMVKSYLNGETSFSPA